MRHCFFSLIEYYLSGDYNFWSQNPFKCQVQSMHHTKTLHCPKAKPQVIENEKL